MNSKVAFLILLFCASHYLLVAQYQMVVLKGQNVTMRFDQGDFIRAQLKDGNIYNFRIDHIREFDFISQHNDTISFQAIKKIKLNSQSKKKYGVMFMVAGAALGGVYLINEPIYGAKNQTSLDGLRFVSLCSIGVGGIFFLTANSNIRLNGRSRILAIKNDSRLYRSP